MWSLQDINKKRRSKNTPKMHVPSPPCHLLVPPRPDRPTRRSHVVTFSLQESVRAGRKAEIRLLIVLADSSLPDCETHKCDECLQKRLSQKLSSINAQCTFSRMVFHLHIGHQVMTFGSSMISSDGMHFWGVAKVLNSLHQQLQHNWSKYTSFFFLPLKTISTMK